jgi:probable F420-dependent oxidoreductase
MTPPRPGGLAVDLGLAGVATAHAAPRSRELADLGADGVFTFEGAHDVFFPLVAAAAVPGLDLMTNVAIAFPRSPMHLAHAAWDLQELCGGRFRLGLGSQIKPHIEHRYSAAWSRPAARMRELVLATKAIFAAWEGEAPLRFRGEFFTHTLMTPTFNPGPHPFGPPPVLVGALGPRMTEVTAEVADGLLVMPFNSERHFVERTMPAIERGLTTAGRSSEDLEVIVEVIVATGRDDEELAAATAGVRGLLSFYGSTPSYRPVLDVEGWGDLQPELNAMSKRGEWAAMSGLITDTMVATIGVVGTPESCAAQIIERFGASASRVCCYFPGYPISDERIGELVTALHGPQRPLRFAP